MPTLIALPSHSNWKIILHEFYDIESDEQSFGSDLKFYFMEDLLEMKNIHNGTFIHLGWYPDFSPNGCFKLFVYDSDFEGKIVQQFESPSKQETAKELLAALKQYA